MIRRALAALILLALTGALVAIVWPQLFTLQRTTPVAQAVSLRGAAVILGLVAAVLGTVLALLIRPGRRFLAMVAVLLLGFTGIQVTVLSTRGIAGTGFETDSEATLTVLSWNTLGDAPGVEAIADLVLERRPDIVALPETTEETAKQVAAAAQAAGLPLVSYTVAYDQISKARSTSLLISADLGSYVIGSGASNTAVLPSVVAVPAGGGPKIVAAHAVAPTTAYTPEWRSDLAWLAAQCASEDVILAGDFNATLDHFSGLQAAPGADLGQCRDAGRLGGGGAIGTWPTSLPALVGTPIDHVLATPSWRVSGYRVITDRDGAGSDHRPVLVQLTRAG
ncbi:endonuclease/exonuclease/phosphatase family protein [Naasia sp. SYSU D00057]|uniref:endonuclease/exonuclease/phosphatase family protein n=1 Tax=Naasia sp. SYSU D00057 TaxID=2817380 RepID=UPI001B309B5D|nr:endonuclease/exonuclease/phosphatase family protein [Naasia sp. SYSU D00057]